MTDEKPRFINLTKASEELGVNRTTVYYYLKILSVQTHKFALDRKTYIALEDLERIKAAKAAAEAGEH